MGTRVTVAGAGAVGCVVAASLAAAGHEVSVLARGAALDGIRANGVGFDAGEVAVRARVAADDAASFGVQDLIFICTKAQDLPAMAESLQPLIGAGTVIVPMANGVPFWLFPDRIVQAVDPGGGLARLLPIDQVIGAVVYISAATVEPGLSACAAPPRLVLGEPRGGASARLDGLGDLLPGGRLEIRLVDDIRPPLWTKLVLNVATNLLSVIAGATLEQMCRDPDLGDVIARVTGETLDLAACFGVAPEIDAARLLRMGAAMGAVKTSTLQDYERGRRLEIAAIGDAVLELGARHDRTMPATRALVGLARYMGERRLAGTSGSLP